MPLAIPGVTVENELPSVGGYIYGRPVDALVNSFPTIAEPNEAGIYSLLGPNVINIPDPNFQATYGRNVIPVQILFEGMRCYGWYVDDLMVAYTADSRLALASTTDFSGQLNVLSMAVVVKVGGVTKIIFAYSGTITPDTDVTGTYYRFIPNPGGQYTTIALPVVTIQRRLYLTTDAAADAMRADLYNTRPTILAITTASDLFTYGIYSYSTTQDPTAFASTRPVLGNPYNDPPNQINQIATEVAGQTGQDVGNTTINVTIGGATYPLKFPLWYWIILAIAIIIVILLIIILFVARSKKIRYYPTKKVRGVVPARTSPTTPAPVRPVPPVRR